MTVPLTVTMVVTEGGGRGKGCVGGGGILLPWYKYRAGWLCEEENWFYIVKKAEAIRRNNHHKGR